MMENDVKLAIEKYSMLSPGDRVLCCLSGGADSVALTLCLKNMRIDICACHINHLLRGEESFADEEFCKSFCEENNIMLQVFHKDAMEYSKTTGKSLETAAREMRYAFYEDAAKACGAVKIATAHTASDNLETMLFHLVRGTGLTGLSGIPPVRDHIIRPLIFTDRQSVEDYLRRMGQNYRVDSTNASDEYTRNRIRHQIIPALEVINSAAVRNAAAAAVLLRQDDDFLKKQANYEKTDIECERLKTMHPAVAFRMIRSMLENAGVSMGEITQGHIEDAWALAHSMCPSARIDLPGGFKLMREYDRIMVKGREDTPPLGEIPLRVGDVVHFEGQKFSLSIKRCEKKNVFYKSFNTFYASCGRIDFETLHVRSRRSGDMIALTESGGHKTLKKLFIDKKIPKNRREFLPVVADSHGVIAVYSLGMDIDRAAQDGDSLLQIEFKDGET